MREEGSARARQHASLGVGERELRSVLCARLRARRTEIEQATLTRAYAIADPGAAADPTYVGGLRAAVRAALDYGMTAVERGERNAPPIPPSLLTQARIAVRSGVPLDTVLRRYLAGYTLLGDFLIEEVERSDLSDSGLKRLLRTQAALFDRVLAAVGKEYAREAASRPGPVRQRHLACVRRLLNGELLDTSELNYDFEGFHLGAIASGPRATKALRDLARGLDRGLLLVHYDERTVWAWLGARLEFDLAEVERFVTSHWPPQVSLAFGEPARALSGWRLTHKQAAAALPIALRSQKACIRYADVALFALALKDDLLAVSLRELYLRPLEAERDGGEILRQTLRAYFMADRNVSSAAAAQGVSRQAIAKRLHTVEERLGRPFNLCEVELEVALNLQQLDSEQIATSRVQPMPN